MGSSASVAELPGWAQALLEPARVARLGLTDEAGAPRVLPVTFALGEGTRSSPRSTTSPSRSPGRASSPACAGCGPGPRAALTVDHYEDDWSRAGVGAGARLGAGGGRARQPAQRSRRSAPPATRSLLRAAARGARSSCWCPTACCGGGRERGPLRARRRVAGAGLGSDRIHSRGAAGPVALGPHRRLGVPLAEAVIGLGLLVACSRCWARLACSASARSSPPACWSGWRAGRCARSRASARGPPPDRAELDRLLGDRAAGRGRRGRRVGRSAFSAYDVGIRGFDSLWYHLPWAAGFAQSGPDHCAPLHRRRVPDAVLPGDRASASRPRNRALRPRHAVPRINLGWLGLCCWRRTASGRPRGAGAVS